MGVSATNYEVVAAVDLSQTGRRVAERAGMIAAEFGASLLLLHVAEPIAESFYPPVLGELVDRHRRIRLDELARWLEENSQVEIGVEFVKGSPAWEIIKAEKTARLIVIGSATMDPSDPGPVARRVIRSARHDVLMVRRQPRGPYTKVVVAVDLSPPSAYTLERGIAMSPDGTVTVVVAVDSRHDSVIQAAGVDPDEMRNIKTSQRARVEAALEELIAPYGDQCRPIIQDGPAVAVIEEVSRRESASLVVVGSRGAGATKLVLLGTVASDTVRHVPCDVMVARTQSDFRRP